MSSKEILEHCRAIIPPLSYGSHKGQAGKVAVIGGCREYTGAPYYAAISALKVGTDLSHVFCSEGAATPIKSYSPELIVHPVLKENVSEEDAPDLKDDIVNSVTKWFQAIQALVVGPGLGRDPFIWECTSEIVKSARSNNIPILFDGDGLNLICSNLDLVKDYRRAILTPNVVEYRRLCDSVFPDIHDSRRDTDVAALARELGHVTVVQKGQVDVITDGLAETVECTQQGGPRRCGGQGDMLSGAILSFMAWSAEFNDRSNGDYPPFVLASYAGCALTKHASFIAFKKHKRSTTTPDMINELGQAFEELFPGASTPN